MRYPIAPIMAALALCAAGFHLSVSPACAGWEAGGHVVYAEPRADFAAVIERGFGIQGFAVIQVDPTGFFGLRIDGGFLNYGNESVTVPLSTTVRRVLVEVNTSNNIAMLDVGIQIAAPAGPVRPYLYGSIGLGYFFTESSVKGSNSSDEPFASSLNFDDTTFGNALGGGLRIGLVPPITLDLGVEYRRYREARYLSEGDIIEESDGSVTLRVNESDADLIVYRLGVSFSGK